MIKVTYVSRDSLVISSDSIVVHFGEAWTPSAGMKEIPKESSLGKTIEAKLLVAPNRETQNVKIVISNFA